MLQVFFLLKRLGVRGENDEMVGFGGYPFTAEYKEIFWSRDKIFTCLSFLHIERNFPIINFIPGLIHTFSEGLY